MTSLHVPQSLFGRQWVQCDPAQFGRRARGKGGAAQPRLLLGALLPVVQPLEEEEIGELLDGVEGLDSPPDQSLSQSGRPGILVWDR